MTKCDNTLLNAWIGDYALVEILDVVITYEATLRGLSQGKAAFELLMEGVHTESYPEKVRERLREAEDSRRDRAARESLAVPRRVKVA